MSAVATLARRSLPRRSPEFSSTLHSVVVLGACALLAYAVLAFGAVEDWAIYSLQAGCAILFLLWAGLQIKRGELALDQPLLLPALLFGIAPGLQLALGRSAYAYATRSGIMLFAAYAVLLLAGTEVARRRTQCRRVALILSVFGGVYAAFSLIQGLAGNGKLYWIRQPRFGGWIYGSFVNHGNYAGLMELLAPIPLVLCLGGLVRGGGRFLLGIVAVLTATTIFLSGSRGGMLAFAVQVVVLAAWLLLPSRRTGLAAGLALVFISALGLVALASQGQVLGRFGEQDGLRATIVRDSLRLLAEHPVLGSGLGTFALVYPKHQSVVMSRYVNEAHNDYLQFLVETGCLGGLAMAVFVAILYRDGMRHARGWQRDYRAALGTSAVIGCTGILAHALVEFNLQIPAVAGTFYFLAAIAAANTRDEPSPEERQGSGFRGLK